MLGDKDLGNHATNDILIALISRLVQHRCPNIMIGVPALVGPFRRSISHPASVKVYSLIKIYTPYALQRRHSRVAKFHLDVNKASLAKEPI